MDEKQVSTASALSIAYLEAGTGPLVVLLHGFPDTPHTFDELAPRLVARGFRVVAPWLRGYEPSGPAPDDDYSGLSLGEDVIGLLDALGAPKARLVGHDFGALAVYTAANLAPERIERMVTLAIPHLRAVHLTPRFFTKSYHFLTLPLPGAAARLRRNDFAVVDGIVRRWSPGWKPTAEELAPVKTCFSTPGGVDRALAYYRANFRTTVSLSARARRQREVQQRKTSVPTLALYGADDGALDATQFAQTPAAFTGEYRMVRIDDAGHFVHREQPERVATEIIEFLGPP